MTRENAYISAMLKLLLGASLLLGGLALHATTLELKGNAAITGKILAEKHDQIIVDIGYTVLVIPRNQVVKLLDDNAKAAKAVGAAPESAVDRGFFSVSASLPPERDVRELVNEMGEAVVQVRTPAGLGSGFFINPDGFLITNFHVTEGETQISVEVYLQKNGQIERKVYKQVRIVALEQIRRPGAAAHRGQGRPEIYLRDPGRFGQNGRGRHGFCHRQPARFGTDGDRGNSQHQDARVRGRTCTCRPRRKSIRATAAARSSTCAAKSWA